MKLIKILTAFIALISFQIAAAQWLNVPPPAEARNLMVVGGGVPVAGSSKVSFTEDWDCVAADSPNCDETWTERNSSNWDINASSQIELITDETSSFLINESKALTTTNQYIKVQFLTTTDYPGVVLRYTNTTSHFYQIEFQGAGGFYWSHVASVGGSGTQIGTTLDLGDVSIGDYIGFVVIGTGANTNLYIWKNPTGAAPDAGGTTWGSAAADISWTAVDPGANAVDSGSYVGLFSWQNTSNTKFDNLSAGDVP